MKQKRCSKCKKRKLLTQFSRGQKRSYDGRQYICKQCHKKTAARWYKTNRRRQLALMKARKQQLQAKVNIYKALPCKDCRKKYPSYVMDLDHVRGRKVLNVCSMVRRGRPWQAIKNEIQKCEVVCANCHRERTIRRLAS